MHHLVLERSTGEIPEIKDVLYLQALRQGTPDLLLVFLYDLYHTASDIAASQHRRINHK